MLDALHARTVRLEKGAEMRTYNVEVGVGPPKTKGGPPQVTIQNLTWEDLKRSPLPSEDEHEDPDFDGTGIRPSTKKPRKRHEKRSPDKSYFDPRNMDPVSPERHVTAEEAKSALDISNAELPSEDEDDDNYEEEEEEESDGSSSSSDSSSSEEGEVEEGGQRSPRMDRYAEKMRGKLNHDQEGVELFYSFSDDDSGGVPEWSLDPGNGHQDDPSSDTEDESPYWLPMDGDHYRDRSLGDFRHDDERLIDRFTYDDYTGERSFDPEGSWVEPETFGAPGAYVDSDEDTGPQDPDRFLTDTPASSASYDPESPDDNSERYFWY